MTEAQLLQQLLVNSENIFWVLYCGILVALFALGFHKGGQR